MKIKLDSSVFIFGLGITGLSAIRAIEAKKIYAWDDNQESLNKAKKLAQTLEKKIEFKKMSQVNELDMVIVSPGISISYPTPNKAILDAQKRLKAIITNDIEIFCNNVYDQSKIIGITGTNGKSTVTKMIYDIIRDANFTCQYGGNFGIPVLDFEEGKNFYVLEISSYQLETLKNAKFHCSILLNISTSHINRHKTFYNYAKIKKRIFSNNEKNSCNIINIDNSTSKKVFENTKKELNFLPISKKINLDNGISYINKEININIKDKKLQIEYKLNSEIENSLAAFAASYAFCNIEINKIIESLNKYKPLEHRIEILESKEITFINDSKATNIMSTEYAIQNLEKKFELHLILGGIYDESITANSLKKISSKIKHIFLIGSSSEKISSILIKQKINNFIICNNLNTAIKNAHIMIKLNEKNFKKKPAILLSPACPSFDQWQNFEHRGREFKKLAKQLMNS